MQRIEICQNILQSISDYITDDSKIEAHRAPNHFIRHRKLSLRQLILYLLYARNTSMPQNISGIREEIETLDFPNISKQAISKARTYLHPDLFKELFYKSVDCFYKNLEERKLWHGYHIFAIDGSKYELPNSESNFKFFGQMFGHPNHDRLFTMGLASMIYDVTDDYIVHASFNRYLATERPLAVTHMQNLIDLNIHENSIIIFDRGYYSENLFRYCVKNNLLCLMRLKDTINIVKKRKGSDYICTLPGDDNMHTEDINIRVIEVPLDDGAKEYLATNIPNTTVTTEMFKELYFLRWPIEVKYKELKSFIGVEDFKGGVTCAIFQEFYISMLFSNLASLLKNYVDDDINEKINNVKQNKYRYQCNRSYVIGRLKKFIPKLLAGMASLSKLYSIADDAFRERSPVMPGRTFRRKKNNWKGRTHFPNIKPSC